jgi:beta-glucanase (GH16 family)
VSFGAPTLAPTPTPTPASTPQPPQSPSTPEPFGQDPSLFTLAFHDEFDGTSLNISTWNDHIWWDQSDPDINYGVENGSLKIWPSAPFVNRTIDTDGKYYQTYGYFEIDARLPVGAGVWPAFWLYNHDDPFRNPEMDIMEAYPGGGLNEGWSDASFHPVAYGATAWITGGDQLGMEMINTIDLSLGFHKYGLKWTEAQLTYYFDGVPMMTLDERMSDRMYILLDLAFGNNSGLPSVSGTPQGKGNAFEINYVRAWQFK